MGRTKKIKKTLTQEIVSILKDNAEEAAEGYTGAEWIEAADLISGLPKKTVLAIPWCAWDIVELDEFGEAIKESRYDRLGRRKDLDENGDIDPDWEAPPKRVARYDVLAILIWIPMKREEPDIVLDQVKDMMNDMNIQEVTGKVFEFWGVPIEAIEDQIKARESEEDQEGEKDQEKEVAEATNFTKQLSKGKQKK